MKTPAFEAIPPLTLSQGAQRVIARMNQQGFCCYAVGGCVRDLLRGITPKDYDFTTNATPTQIQDCFADCRTIETGIAHGTITVLVDHTPYEITTHRTERGYEDHRHPIVTFGATLVEDLKRRDFTINAFAYHPTEGLLDLFDGQTHLKNQLLCCVGDPKQRFFEDALRILRGLRFAATLGFAIEAKTVTAMQETAGLLPSLSVERIFQEFSLLCCGGYATDVMTTHQTVLQPLWQILPSSVCDSDLIQGVSLYPFLPPQLPLRLAALFYTPHQSPTEQVRCAVAALKAWKVDRKTLLQVSEILKEQQPPSYDVTDRVTLRQLLSRVGADTATAVLAFQQAVAAYEKNTTRFSHVQQLQGLLPILLTEGDCYRLCDLALHGNDLQRLGFQGKRIGQALQQLLLAVMEERVENTGAALTDYLLKNIDK